MPIAKETDRVIFADPPPATLVDVTGLCIYFLVALVIFRALCYGWKVEVIVCIYPVLVASYLP